MGKNTNWLLDELMPLRFGAVSLTGYRSEGVTVRRFLENEKHHGAGFVQLHHGQRIFEVVLDSENLAGCCVALYLVGLHENIHAAGGDIGPGTNALKISHGPVEVQEARAWRFVREAAGKVTAGKIGKPDLIMFCFEGCVRAKEKPTRCKSPDLGGLLEQLESAAKSGGPSLAAALREQIKSSGAWFKKAAKGLKREDGSALVARKPYPAKGVRKKRAARGTEGRIITFPRKSSRILEGRAFKNKHLSERCGGRIERPTRATDSILRAAGGQLFVKKWVVKATGEVLNLR